MHVTTLARFRPEKEGTPGSHVTQLAEEYESKIDTILTWSVEQAQFYKDHFQPHVTSVLGDRLNNTVIAYGYSGSGKTYTLEGMIRLALADIFKAPRPPVDVALAVIEIYVNKTYDLLEPGEPVSILGDGTVCSSRIVSQDPVLLERELTAALLKRRTRATALNHDSSRSHTIAIIEVALAKLFIVDLAGCERVARSKAAGISLVEAIAINKSLSSLHAVVAALTDPVEANRVHIPYRDSKITMALKQALGGNSRTSFILCCGSGAAQTPESRQTLEFGSRCRAIVTDPRRLAPVGNPKDILIAHLQERIALLEGLVAGVSLQSKPEPEPEPEPQPEPQAEPEPEPEPQVERQPALKPCSELVKKGATLELAGTLISAHPEGAQTLAILDTAVAVATQVKPTSGWCCWR